jgi:hypothetical protein
LAPQSAVFYGAITIFFACLSVCLSVCLCVSLYFCCLSICLSIFCCLSICLSVPLTIFLPSFYLSCRNQFFILTLVFLWTKDSRIYYPLINNSCHKTFRNTSDKFKKIKVSLQYNHTKCRISNKIV